MRHRIGMVLAVIMAGVLFFPGAWGYLRLLRMPAAAGQLAQLPAGGGSLISDHNVLIAFAAMAGTGLLAGILIAVPRISPLAAGTGEVIPGLAETVVAPASLSPVPAEVLAPLPAAPWSATRVETMPSAEHR